MRQNPKINKQVEQGLVLAVELLKDKSNAVKASVLLQICLGAMHGDQNAAQCLDAALEKLGERTHDTRLRDKVFTSNKGKRWA